jgi:hypothetical protein
MNEFQVLLMYSFKQLQWLLILAMKRSLWASTFRTWALFSLQMLNTDISRGVELIIWYNV